MKRILFLLNILLISYLPSIAYDFSYTYEGQTIRYNVLSSNNKTCEADGASSGISGDLILPAHPVFDGEEYTLTSIDWYAFYGCSGLTSVTIPNSVTSIGEKSFYGCSGLTSVIIGNSVTSIGKEAFDGCSGLKKCAYPNTFSVPFSYGICVAYDPEGAIIEDGVIYGPEKSKIMFVPLTLKGDYVIPNSVTSIGEKAFYGCSGLTSVSIPNSVTSIGEESFYGCSGLTSVSIPNSVTSIGEESFYGCSGLTSVSIPNSVTSIGSYAFSGCSGVKNLTLEDGISPIAIGGGSKFSNLEVLNLGRNVNNISLFQDLKTLTIVNISDSVTSIPESMFYKCSSLRSITIPISVMTIGENAFSKCTSLKSINIQDGETPIRIEASTNSNGRGSTFDEAPIQTIYMGRNVEYTSTELSPFKNILSLTDLTIGNKVTVINNYLFYGCTNISNMAVPSSVKTIGDYSFYDCSNSTLLVISSSVETIGEYAFYNCRRLTSITIPNSVVSVGDYAFRSCVGTKKIKIGNGVKSIGAYAFLDCREAEEINIGDSVETIGDNAFYNCSALKNIVVPDDVVSIGANAFTLCISAEKLYLGRSVNQIGARAFSDCENLQEVSCAATEPPLANEDTFSDYSAPLLVPNGCMDFYKSAYGNCWPLFKIIREGIVSSIEPESIELNFSKTEIYQGDHIYLNATIFPETATDKSVKWSSSNSGVATVSEDGVVNAVKQGTAIITASTVNGLTASCEVIVLPILVESIILDPMEIQVVAGNSFTISATVLPENATNKELIWKSNNPYIAKVDNQGHVEILKEGNCLITAIATDGSEVSGECVITALTGIEAIFADSNEAISVYNTNGILVIKDCTLDELRNLAPGIYILKGYNNTHTVIIH